MAYTRKQIEALTRRHIGPTGWGFEPATDFWLIPAANGMITATNAHELADYGWTTTALALVAGTAADFMAAADKGTTGHFLFDAASDLLQSPAVFGDYAHAYMAQRIFLGSSLPTKLVLECLATFTTVANNETATCFGFVEAGGSPITANDAMAMIFSDGTNFKLRSGAATSAAGAAVDTSVHLWKIVIDSAAATVSWYIDGTLQNTIVIEADLWPVSFGAGIVAAGANRLQLGQTHIYYDS